MFSGLLALCVVAPVGFFGIRYLTFEDGPHTRLPDVCAAVTSEEATRYISPPGNDISDVIAGEVTAGCQWSLNDYARLAMRVVYHQRTMQRGSIGYAERDFDSQVAVERTALWPSEISIEVDVPGIGDESVCIGRTRDGVNVNYECVVRDANAVLRLSFSRSFTLETEIPEEQLITAETFPASAKIFAVSLAAPFLKDLVAAL